MNRGQMELSLGKAAKCSSYARRQRRLQRARWWFDRMRDAVDQAGPEDPMPSLRSLGAPFLPLPDASPAR